MFKQLYSLLFVLFLFGYSPMSAQRNKVCTTQDQHLLLERITQNRLYHETNPGMLDSRMPIYIPIKFNMLAEFDGAGRIRYSSVLDQLCRLNEDYNQFDIFFYLDNNGTDADPDYFNLIDHTGVFNDPRTTASQTILFESKDDDAVNVYIINDAGSSGATTSAGFYTPGGDYIVMEKGQVSLNNTTLTHEAGHFFSLAHPHTGWEDTGWGNADPNIYSPIYAYGTTITNTNTQSSQSSTIAVELVNGSNCTNSGDNICDTPPDYGFGPHQGSCLFSQKVYDRNGDEVKPMEENIMGYFNNCNYEFTADQTEAVKSDFMSPGRSHLRSSYVPAVTGIVDQIPVVLSPLPSTTADYYNSVEFAWEPVQNATGYLLEISDIAGNLQSFFSKSTSILLENLEPNSTYLWFVQPFNEMYSCTKSTTAFLMTNDLNTGINEISELNEINVFPNPVRNNEMLKLHINANNKLDAEMMIYHVSGKLIKNQAVSLNSGENKLEIDVADFTKGLYIIKLRTEEGISTESFVVN